MAISEQQRRSVFVRLEQVLGADAADLLMQMLPRVPNDDLATRSDMHALTAMLRGEMAEFRAELQGEMAEFRAELQGEMSEFRAELRGEMAEFRGEVRSEIAGLQRWLAGVVAANAVTVITVLVA